MHSGTSPSGSYVLRVDVVSKAIVASVPTQGYLCYDFAFDDALFGADTIICMATSQPGFYTEVAAG